LSIARLSGHLFAFALTMVFAVYGHKITHFYRLSGMNLAKKLLFERILDYEKKNAFFLSLFLRFL